MDSLGGGQISELKVESQGKILITKQKITIQAQFRNMDKNQNGYLSFAELEMICRYEEENLHLNLVYNVANLVWSES